MSVTAIPGQQITSVETLLVKRCPVCSIIYALPEGRLNRCEENGENWYCPNGHSLVFITTKVQEKEKEIERLKASLNYSNQRAELHQQNYINAERKRAALKGVITKTKKRAANGVCPCCNRYFVNVHRHMQSKHPDHGKATE